MTAFRLLANANNTVPAASVTASSVLAATRNVFPHPTSRQGNGQVVLSGGYTGANDAAIEIEIRPPSGSGVRVSSPLFAGAGNGTMEQPTAAPGSDAQAVTVTLVDVGTETTRAQAILYGDLLLRAKTAGDGGNALQLTVAPALTLSAQPVGALSAALNADTQEWTDARHDFGAVALLLDGTLPDTAPRLVFGRNPSRVYRHYKRWDGSQWRYGVSPKLAADHVTGSEVHTVTGNYTAGLSDGVTTESYPGIVTLYDLLTALSASALIEVIGAIANDRKPGGTAAVDLPIRTTSLALPATASDPKRMPGLRAVIATPSARTETLTIECVANAPIGAERWAVRSRVFSALTEAVTGIPYTDGPAQFTVPIVPRNATSPPVDGVIAITRRSFPRPTDDKIGIPALCLDRPVLGAKSSGKTLKLVWSARPPAECDCKESNVLGRPNPVCLGVGITTDDGGASMATLVADYQSRLILLYQKRRDFIVSNTEKASGGELRSAEYDIQLMEQAATLFAQCLAELFADSDAPATAALTAWDTALTGLDADLTSLTALGTVAAPTAIAPLAPNTAYDVGDVATIFSFGYGRCIGAGTTGVATDGYRIDFGTTAWAKISRAEALATFTTDDINAIPDANNGFVFDIETFVRRYQSAMDHVRALAGLVPKSEASRAGGMCWRDPGESFYWEFDEEAYLPAFNNVYYHSAVLDADGNPLSTQEFGFALRCGCPERLKLGDTLILRIGVGGDVKIDYPYQIGDRYEIPLIGGGPLDFSGGITGTDTLTWRVESSTQTLPDYLLTLAELAYSAGGLGFAIHRGALAFALGDQFRFAVETGGQWRWRKDGGAWSADADIADSAALAEGLTVAFVSGAAPSFENGDVYRYTVRQPHSPSHVQSAHGETWRWSGATATLTLTFPADQPVSVLGLLRHELIAPAAVTVTLLDAADVVLHSFVPLIRPGPLLEVLDEPVTARKLSISLTDADEMALGWVYAGLPFFTRHQPSITLKRHWAMERGSERNPRGAYLGRGVSGEIQWENWLMQSEFDDLLALLDACKQDGDAPLVLVPNVEIPGEAALARVDSDALEVSDVFDFQPNPNERRLLSFVLPLAPVLT